MNEQMSVVLGTVAMEPKGEYSSEAYYEKLNAVLYNDSTYMAIKPSHNILPTDTEYWQLIGGGAKKEETVQVFDTVADMKLADLKDGMSVQTLGYYEPNDGGNAEYLIKASSTNYYEDLNNGLVAELIVDKIVNVNQLGAYGDGIHDDTNVVQSAFDNFENIEFVANKTYIINGVDTTRYVNINGNNAILKASDNCDYILKSYSTNNKYNGTIKDLTFDGNNYALDCILNDDSFRRVYKNIRLNNPRNNGSGFHQINRGGGTRLESINGYQTNISLDTTFLKIEGPDVNINMADYIGFKTGLYSSSNVQINQFHGFILTTNDLNVYENSKFIHLNGGRFTGINVYPDTQQFWFYIGDIGDYQIIGGDSYHNPLLPDTLIAQTTLGKGYVVYTNSQEKVRRFHLSNFSLTTPSGIENIDFCNSIRYTFATTNISLSYDTKINYFEWYTTTSDDRLTDIVTPQNSTNYTNNLKLYPDGDKIKITGSVTFNTSYSGTNAIDILTANNGYSFINDSNYLILPTLYGDDANAAAGNNVKFLVENNKLRIRKLSSTSLENKKVYLCGYVYLRNIK